jgi:hypothetical protein
MLSKHCEQHTNSKWTYACVDLSLISKHNFFIEEKNAYTGHIHYILPRYYNRQSKRAIKSQELQWDYLEHTADTTINVVKWYYTGFH